MRHPSPPDAWLHLARALLDDSCAAPLSLERLASQLGVSRYHLIRAFRRVWGVTPHQYRTLRRIERAKTLLTSSDLTITEICFHVGFHSHGSFSALFRRCAGCSPHAYRLHARRRDYAIARAIPRCLRIMYGSAA
jgi:AraC-like DNA-binding protein